MNYRDLFNRDTDVIDVYYDYVHPRLDTDYEDPAYATRLKVHGVFIGIIALISLILLFATKWSIAGWVTAAILITATIFIRQIFHITVGYGTWVLARYGIYVWAATAVLSFIGGITTKATGLFALFFMALVSLVASIIITATGGLIGWLNNRNTDGGGGYVDAEPNTRTPADDVWEKLLTALSTHYSPTPNFVDIPRPTQHDYETKEEYITALQEHEETISERKMDVVDSYIDKIVDDPSGNGLVTVTLRTEDERGLLNNLNAKLGFYGVKRVFPAAPQPGGTVIFTVETTPKVSPLVALTSPIPTEVFFRENPMTNLDSFPCGLSADGTVWHAPLHHTLVVARTGGGKGSHAQTLIYQMMPYIKKGLVRIWLADPKPAESLPYVGTSALYRVATEDDDMIELIQDFHREMAAQRSREDIGRSNTATTENPINILMLDEAADFLDDKAVAGVKDDDGRTIVHLMKAVSRKGRSLNFFLFLYSQEVTSDPLGTLPKNLPVKLGGYMESSYEMSKSLGMKEAQLEYYKDDIIFPIPESNKANGMKYAGIFNVKMDDARMAIRIPYVSEEMIQARLEEFGLDGPHTYTETVSQSQNRAQKQSHLPDDYDPRNPLGKQTEQALEQLNPEPARDPELEAMLAAFTNED